MRCPLCQIADIKEHVSIKGIVFKKKVYCYFCPLCQFTNIRKFRISSSDAEIDYAERRNKAVKINQENKNG